MHETVKGGCLANGNLEVKLLVKYLLTLELQ